MAGQRPETPGGILWLRPEIAHNLAVAREAVERYAEDDGHKAGLREAIAELREVASTAQLIQVAGVAVAAKDLADTLDALSQQQVPDAAACAQAVMSGIVQLDDYTDALAAGLPDHLLALHPALSDLRVARGQPVLSESDVFAAQLSAQCVVLPFDGPRPGAPPARALARKYESAYQQALVQWLRGGVREAVGRIGKLSEAFANGVDDAAEHMLWRCMAAVAESVIAGRLEASMDLKRVVGRSGAAARALAAGTDFPEAQKLAGGLLLHLGRVERPAARTRAVVEALELPRYLPDETALARMRARLHGANSELVARLSEELRGDLQRVKDHIDLRVRARAGDMDEARSLLDQMAHTLAMLGLPALARVARNQLSLLANLLDEDADHNHPGWLDIASALLRVEVSLDEALYRQISQGTSADGGEGTGEEIPNRADLQSGQRALLRESQINLSRLKTGVDSWLRNGDRDGLAGGGALLHEVVSALQVLEQQQAADLVRSLAAQVEAQGLEALCGDADRAACFAEAVSALEFYLEALGRGHADTGMLATLEGLLPSLEPSVEASPPEPAAGGAEEGAADTATEPEIAARDTTAQAFPEAPGEATTPSSEPAQPQTEQGEAGQAEAEEVDEEIRGVFLEEAAEVQQTLEASLARWQRDHDNTEAMLEVRRGFHTLKGSGRMVQAEAVGEFAWSCEQLLNACRDGGLAVSQDIVDFTAEAVAFVPKLVAAFAEARPEDAETLALLQARAEALRRGAADDEAEDLRSVFREDAAAQLGLASRWLSEGEAEAGVSSDVIRAFHTLRGAAGAIGSTHFSDSAAAAERLLNRLYFAGRGAGPEAVACLREMVDRLRQCVDDGSLEAPADLARDWQQRLAELAEALPQPQGDDEAAGGDAAALQLLDALQNLEGALGQWQNAPQEAAAREAVASRTREVAATAGHAGFAGMAGPAERLASALPGALPQTAEPDTAVNLDEIVELFYQRLDRLREAPEAPPDDPLDARIEAFVAAAAVEAAGPADESAEALPDEAPDEVADQAADTVDAPAATPDTAPEEIASGDSPGDTGAAAAAAGDEDEDAAELREIFVGEAQELLEAVDRTVDALQQDPLAEAPALELARALHTLKGSARMAGQQGIGEVAHRCENLLDAGNARGEGVDVGVVRRLHHVSDGLFGVVEALREARTEEAEGRTRALLDELEDFAGETGETTGEAPAERPGGEVAAAPTAAEAETAAPPETGDARGPPAPPSGAELPLAASFAEELAQLLATVGQSLTRWERDSEAGVPADEAGAVVDLQRALHTLKGSARIADRGSLAAAAQEMEAIVNDMARGHVAPDSASFQQLRTRMEQLQYLARDASSGVEEDEGAYFDSSYIDQLGPREATAEPAAEVEWDPRLTPEQPEGEAARPAMMREQARVPVPTLESLLNEAGEISVLRARLEQQNSGVGQQLQDLGETVVRLRDQLRQMNAETEAQIAARGLDAGPSVAAEDTQDFDPLEMDRYSRMQELARALAESVGDIEALHGAMRTQIGESNALLVQQQRINSELQQGLMGTLMVPFARQTQRLQRVVRQVAQEVGKQARLVIEGEDIEVDRNVLERMTAPLEHALRNAVIHGIEPPEARTAAGKDATGTVRLSLTRDGQMLRLVLSDDGAGLDYEAIRRTAIAGGLMGEQAQLSEAQLALFILEPGFSTADTLTHSAGRGVGMEVLAAEVRQLGGALEIHSERGAGTRFEVRLPITLGLARALMFRVGEEGHAAPLAGILGVSRAPRSALSAGTMEYGGQEYRLVWAGDYLGQPRPDISDGRAVPAILLELPEGVGDGARRIALLVDEITGNREIVSKPIGPVLASVPGMSGATILPDGRVVLLLDLVALLGDRIRRQHIAETAPPVAPQAEARAPVMVVDDSVTMRRVAERLLKRNGYEVLLARDGVDAMSQLATARPAVVLLDIEMPRADGFEVASYMRNSQALRDTPIVMITSRSGDKHRQRAAALGVERYLIKPYQEAQLLAEIRALGAEAAA